MNAEQLIILVAVLLFVGFTLGLLAIVWIFGLLLRCGVTALAVWATQPPPQQPYPVAAPAWPPQPYLDPRLGMPYPPEPWGYGQPFTAPAGWAPGYTAPPTVVVVTDVRETEPDDSDPYERFFTPWTRGAPRGGGFR